LPSGPDEHPERCEHDEPGHDRRDDQCGVHLSQDYPLRRLLNLRFPTSPQRVWRHPKEVHMATWLLILIIVLVILALFGGIGYRRW
jgi:hypothetical protein